MAFVKTSNGVTRYQKMTTHLQFRTISFFTTVVFTFLSHCDPKYCISDTILDYRVTLDVLAPTISFNETFLGQACEDTSAPTCLLVSNVSEQKTLPISLMDYYNLSISPIIHGYLSPWILLSSFRTHMAMTLYG